MQKDKTVIRWAKKGCKREKQDKPFVRQSMKFFHKGYRKLLKQIMKSIQ